MRERYHDLDTFLERVAETSQLAGETEAPFAAEAAARVVARHITPHELTKVGSVLPRGIAELLSDASKEPDDRARARPRGRIADDNEDATIGSGGGALDEPS